MWKLTAFVLDLSNQRRKGAIPEAGLLKPLPGVEARRAGASTVEPAGAAAREAKARVSTSRVAPSSGSEFGSD